jgi:hypothetical protein
MLLETTSSCCKAANTSSSVSDLMETQLIKTEVRNRQTCSLFKKSDLNGIMQQHLNAQIQE